MIYGHQVETSGPYPRGLYEVYLFIITMSILTSRVLKINQNSNVFQRRWSIVRILPENNVRFSSSHSHLFPYGRHYSIIEIHLFFVKNNILLLQ